MADGTLISAESRAALFASMPSDAGDFSGTLGAALAIADAEAAAAGVPAAATELFKNELALHYKAGNDIWCDPICLSSYSISGLAEIPRCSGASQVTGQYAWGSSSATARARSTPRTRSSPNGDCHSFVCAGGVCQPASCAPTRNQGAPCGSDADCGSDVCSESGICLAPACSPSCSTGEVRPQRRLLVVPLREQPVRAGVVRPDLRRGRALRLERRLRVARLRRWDLRAPGVLAALSGSQRLLG